MAGGGLFVDFGAVRTASSNVDRITSKSPQNSKRNHPPPPFPDTTSPDPPLPLHDRDAPRRYTACLEEVKLRDMQLLQLQKEISEWEAKLKQQQHLYEAVRSDRNLYSKNLLEAQDEISEMKRKAKIQAHQLGQLKEEISGKDAALVKISFAHKKIDKQYESSVR